MIFVKGAAFESYGMQVNNMQTSTGLPRLDSARFVSGVRRVGGLTYNPPNVQACSPLFIQSGTF
jgi:hypothetical protein